VRALALAFLLLGGIARADSEQALSVGGGFATFSTLTAKMGEMQPVEVNPTGGGVLVGSYERAIGTDVALRAEFAGAMFFGGNTDKQSSRSYALLGDAGLVFRFDVFKWVPYAFAGLGAVTARGGPIENGSDFVLVIGGGLDRLSSRNRSYGVELRVASFGGDITVVTLGFRGTRRWGFL
jgi:hypothetical protein